MARITNIEKGAFLSLFNRAGNVLNFSTYSFDVFTQNSIGLALCNQYGLSKGKSLTAYINEACESDVIKLLGDLLEWERIGIHNDGHARDRLVLGAGFPLSAPGLGLRRALSTPPCAFGA